MSAQLAGGQVGPISSGTVPVGIMLDAPIGYHIAVEVTCAPTAAAVARWQQRTYEAVRQAYDIKQGEFREAASAAAPPAPGCRSPVSAPPEHARWNAPS